MKTMMIYYLFQPVEHPETCFKLLEVYPLISKKSRKIEGKFLDDVETGCAGDREGRLRSQFPHHRCKIQKAGQKDFYLLQWA